MAERFKYLLLDDRSETVHVTINRPQDRNSINSCLMAEIVSLLDQVEKTSARALVFSGAGETYFIGGADGVEMMQLSPNEARAFSKRIQALFNRIEASPLITVAAINGLCFGGGYEFALACDFRVASETARIGLPEVKVGLIPGGGGTQRLPMLVGMGKAIEMILSGRLYKGTEAAEMGLVHLTVSPGRLDAGVRQVLDPVLKQPQYALSLAKHAVYASRSQCLPDGLAVESEQFSRCFEGDFFLDLMQRQLADGSLATSEDVARTARKEKP
jgi:enoyl-CoA hydratase/carnithine racemase